MALEFWMATGRIPGTDRFGTVEVVREIGVEQPVMVLCSDSEHVDSDLTCRIGFSSDPERCDRMTSRGYTVVEATITRSDDGYLEVRAAAFARPEGKNEVPRRELDYACPVLKVTGVHFAPAVSQGLSAGLAVIERTYRQEFQTLDGATPARRLRRRIANWVIKRRPVPPVAPGSAQINMASLRWPETLPALQIAAEDVSSGSYAVADPWEARLSLRQLERKRTRVERPEQFGSSDSTFRDIEVLGFRLDIPSENTLTPPAGKAAVSQEQKLFGMIAPLNFHLDRSGANDDSRPDFYYRPATTGLTIELLRYGRMCISEDSGELTKDDFESQHELLVRLVVGRVDEDSAQAQEPATFVPAIFVNNSWSKFLGRRFMGLDKRMAYFCATDESGEAPLSPRDAATWEPDAGRKRPPTLANVTSIRLAPSALPEIPADATGVDLKAIETDRRRMAQDPEAHAALEIACNPDLIDDWDTFELAPTDAVLSRSPLAPRRWQQEDFEDAEVRRDFARAAASGSTGSFIGIQSVPLGRHDIRYAWKKERTWIIGRYKTAGSAMLARPRGTITITLRRLPSGMVRGWDQLCDLFNVPMDGDRALSIPVGAGSWYRLLYDMDLSLENGLE